MAGNCKRKWTNETKNAVPSLKTEHAPKAKQGEPVIRSMYGKGE